MCSVPSFTTITRKGGDPNNMNEVLFGILLLIAEIPIQPPGMYKTLYMTISTGDSWISEPSNVPLEQ